MSTSASAFASAHTHTQDGPLTSSSTLSRCDSLKHQQGSWFYLLIKLLETQAPANGGNGAYVDRTGFPAGGVSPVGVGQRPSGVSGTVLTQHSTEGVA